MQRYTGTCWCCTKRACAFTSAPQAKHVYSIIFLSTINFDCFVVFDGDECKTEGCRIGRGCGFLQNYHRKFHASVCRCLIVLRCGGVAEWGGSRKPSYQCCPGACNRVPAIGARGSLLPLCTCNLDIRPKFFPIHYLRAVDGLECDQACPLLVVLDVRVCASLVHEARIVFFPLFFFLSFLIDLYL